MFSPMNDMYKMWAAPPFILFKVSIDGQEKYGRVITLHMEHPFKDKIYHGTFLSFQSVNQFLSGSKPEETLKIKPSQIIGLDAIDTISQQDPTPLKRMLQACNDINNLEKTDNVNVIRSYASLLDPLCYAIEDYGNEHPKSYAKATLLYLGELQTELENTPYKFSDNDVIDKNMKLAVVRDLKEKISYVITRLFVFGDEK